MHDELKLEACNHSTLRFHSGGYYVGCVGCNAYWVAIKHPNEADTALDYDRRSPLAGMGDLHFASRTLPPDEERITELLRRGMADAGWTVGGDPEAIIRGERDGEFGAGHPARRALRLALSLTRTAGGEELTEGAVLAWMRRTGRTSIALVEDVDAHIASLPVRSGEVVGAVTRLRSLVTHADCYGERADQPLTIAMRNDLDLVLAALTPTEGSGL